MNPKQHRLKKTLYSIPIAGLLFSLSGIVPVMAWDSEIRVDGQLIPAELIDGYQAQTNGIESHCPPISDRRDRDSLVRTWVRTTVAEERGLQFNERGVEQDAKLKAELASERAEKDSQYRNLQLWNIMRHKSNNYWTDTIGKVTESEIKAEYDRLVEQKDPRFVNAPFFKLMLMETNDEQYLKQLADRLRAGETWRQVSADVDPLDWNSHNKDMWFTFDRLDRYRSKAFHALNLDGSELQRSDVIGPLAEVGRYRLIVILDKTTEAVIPYDAELMNQSNWARGQVRGDLFAQRHKALDASLLEKVEVTENGKPVTISLTNERCPA